MSDPIRIGQLASRTGRSVHTLRWYEAQGLIPGVIRDAGGRRRYSEQHVAWLQFMERLRHTGMSIKQMREYTALVAQGHATLTRRQEILNAHRDRVRRAVEEWTEALELLDSKIDFYDQWQKTGKRPSRDFMTTPAQKRKHA
ncbi:MerR family transcriptional regulator [Corallococcus sp. M34]|uniref:MerR family transcriptional regulator n=1 Tax=Citreicoccus inhibens TaxID=2849499 RepID=UPI001C239C77|nr:MerR family transcriptional regulator [Citreicoccus inhibens]MBU8898902.1 MerR family transcriptional regulator [Citreicoccus inhibens]